MSLSGVGERELKDILEEVKEQIVNDLVFITDKMKIMRSKIRNNESLDIHQMADFHRYSETRLFLVDTLKSLEGDDGADG